MTTLEPPDTPELVDPDAPISNYHCAICGDPETTARPITNWAFSMEDGHWHILICHQCAHDQLGKFFREITGIRAGSFETWKSNYFSFIRQYGAKAMISGQR